MTNPWLRSSRYRPTARDLAKVTPRDADQLPVVPFLRPRCGWCSSPKTKQYGKSRGGTKEYRICLACRRRFFAVELDPGKVSA